MKFLKLSMKNFKKHIALEIDFNQSINIIHGNNNAGKTTILHAIKWCLFGGSDDALITNGKNECSVSLVTIGKESITITRSLKRGKKQSLVVESNGHKLSAPQGVINRYFNGFEIDPLSFIDLDVTEQRQRILQANGVKTNRAKIEANLGVKIPAYLDDRNQDLFESNPILAAKNVYNYFYGKRADLATNIKRLNHLIKSVESDLANTSDIGVTPESLSVKRHELSVLSQKRVGLESILSERNRIMGLTSYSKEDLEHVLTQISDNEKIIHDLENDISVLKGTVQHQEKIASIKTNICPILKKTCPFNLKEVSTKSATNVVNMAAQIRIKKQEVERIRTATSKLLTQKGEIETFLRFNSKIASMGKTTDQLKQELGDVINQLFQLKAEVENLGKHVAITEKASALSSYRVDLKKLESEHTNIDDVLQKIKKLPEILMAETGFNIPGIRYTGHSILFHNVPAKELSDAVRFAVSLQLVKSIQKQAKTFTIDRMEILDHTNMNQFIEKNSDFQIIGTFVGSFPFPDKVKLIEV